MRISQVEIKNFRLLADVELVLEDQTTVIVGRNKRLDKSCFTLVLIYHCIIGNGYYDGFKMGL